ncbi:MAG TPA: hypothetical protein VH393_13505 [Ktedonobacterales bacterium]|jgi:hypothetical protein
MVTRICSLVVRIGGSLALLLGLLRYFNIGPDLVQLHMTLGILVVLALWILATIYARTPDANLGMAIGASVIGLLLLIVGVTQQGLLPDRNFHWIIQVIHVLLGLTVIGMGESLAGAIRRAPPALA